MRVYSGKGMNLRKRILYKMVGKGDIWVYREEPYGGSIYNKEYNYIIRCDQDFLESFTGEKSNRTNHCLEEPLYASSPEKVHLHITNKCNRWCNYCYVHLGNSELSIENIKSRLKECLDLKVFQIAIGGGEPTLHSKFMEILEFIAQIGIDATMTTNGKILDKNILEMVPAALKLVSVSADDLRYPELFIPHSRDYSVVKESIEQYLYNHVNVGLNFVYGQKNWRSLDKAIVLSSQLGVKQISFLLQKESTFINYDWCKEMEFQNTIQQLVSHAKLLGVALSFDVCSTWVLNQAFYEGPNYFQGFSGCDAGRFCLSVEEDNTILPCSFLGNEWKYYGSIKDAWNSILLCRCRSLSRSCLLHQESPLLE
jgi:MoaA/NifB/PqqE/SkfB family radical SAM enzyme